DDRDQPVDHHLRLAADGGHLAGQRRGDHGVEREPRRRHAGDDVLAAVADFPSGCVRVRDGGSGRAGRRRKVHVCAVESAGLLDPHGQPVPDRDRPEPEPSGHSHRRGDAPASAGRPRGRVSEDLMAKTSTTLSSAVTVNDTSIVVASATGLGVGNIIVVDQEVMQVTKGWSSGTTVPVLRGRDGTATAAHKSGAMVTIMLASDLPTPLSPQTFVQYQTQKPNVRTSYSASGAITLP